MRLGFLTASMPERSLEDVVRFATAAGFQAIEVAAWRNTGERAFTASHLDVAALTAREAERLRMRLERAGLRLSSIAYYDNNLAPDLAERAAVHDHVRRCIDAAAMLDCPTVGTFVGRDGSRSVRENVAIAEPILGELARYAGDAGVRLMIENCPMEGWHVDGYPGNLAYSPELWDWLIGLGLTLNFDPSHLVWLGIDPLWALDRYADHVVHVHAKDIETFPERRNRYGAFGKTIEREDPWDVGWWRYRIPGLGAIDWTAFVDRLYQHGYAGTVSVEHEDPVWGGTPELVDAGLRRARRHLAPILGI